MTACAMTVGMVPMALALEQGSQMQAPLGRAVIGGLVMSTFATLLVLPSIFALVIGRKVASSPSIYPDDPESKHYDPMVFVNEVDPATATATTPHDAGHDAATPTAHDVGGPGTSSEDVLVFLRRILDEARSKRHDMVTHYTVDDLRGRPRLRQAETPERPDAGQEDSTGRGARPRSGRSADRAADSHGGPSVAPCLGSRRSLEPGKISGRSHRAPPRILGDR